MCLKASNLWQIMSASVRSINIHGAISTDAPACNFDNVDQRVVRIDNPITKWHFYLEDRDDTDVSTGDSDSSNNDDDDDDNDGDLIDRRFVARKKNNNQMGENNTNQRSVLGKRHRQTKSIRPKKRAKHQEKDSQDNYSLSHEDDDDESDVEESPTSQ
jgi:hypothetical protein